MVSDRKISQQKKQQGEGTTNAKEKERAKGDGGSKFKGRSPKIRNPERAMGWSLVLSTLQKYLCTLELVTKLSMNLLNSASLLESILQLYMNHLL